MCTPMLKHGTGHFSTINHSQYREKIPYKKNNSQIQELEKIKRLERFAQR
jgi:hypothetical protein